MSGDVFDAQGEAHEALGTAVGSYGKRVLSDPRMLGNLVTDLLPDQPRERSLLVAAAEAGVADELVQHVEGQRIDVDTAVALVARSLTEGRSLDLMASLWVATEFAQALGYQTRSQGAPTVIGRPMSLSGADTIVPKAPPASPPVPGSSDTRMDLRPLPRFTPTQQPAAPAAPAAQAQPGGAWHKSQDAWAQTPAPAAPPPPTQQPWSPAPAPPPQQWQPTEVAQPAPPQPTQPPPQPWSPAPASPSMQQLWQPTEVAPPPQQPQQPWSPAPAQAWQPTPPAPPLNPWPAAAGGGRPPRSSRTGLIFGAAVAAVIVLYLVIAAVAQTFPFSKSSAKPSASAALSGPTAQPPTGGTSPAGTPTGRPRPTPSVAPSPAGTLAAGVKKLKVLLPFDITDASTECATQAKVPWQNPGLVSALECNATDLASGQVFGYQLDSTADYTTAWHNYNSWAKFTASGSAGCPPKSGQSEGGPIGWYGPRFKKRSGQEIECFTSSTGGPVYVWTYPTEDAFIVAQPPKSWSYKKLETWWEDEAK